MVIWREHWSFCSFTLFEFRLQTGLQVWIVTFFVVDQAEPCDWKLFFQGDATPLFLVLPELCIRQPVWSGREKPFEILHCDRELNPGQKEDRQWAIPLSYHDWGIEHLLFLRALPHLNPINLFWPGVQLRHMWRHSLGKDKDRCGLMMLSVMVMKTR